MGDENKNEKYRMRERTKKNFKKQGNDLTFENFIQFN